MRLCKIIKIQDGNQDIKQCQNEQKLIQINKELISSLSEMDYLIKEHFSIFKSKDYE